MSTGECRQVPSCRHLSLETMAQEDHFEGCPKMHVWACFNAALFSGAVLPLLGKILLGCLENRAWDSKSLWLERELCPRLVDV